MRVKLTQPLSDMVSGEQACSKWVQHIREVRMEEKEAALLCSALLDEDGGSLWSISWGCLDEEPIEVLEFVGESLGGQHVGRLILLTRFNDWSGQAALWMGHL